MIEIIAGEKGKGKTKELLAKVNHSVAAASGNIVYLDKSQKHMYELNNKVRLINVMDYPIDNCDVTNLNVHKYLAGHLGGSQQLGAQIEHNEIDLVIFLRDPLTPKSHEPDVNNVVKLCDTHNIPLATNLATAELLIRALDRGDLEWREMYK